MLFTIITKLLHFGMMVVFAGQMKVYERTSLPAPGACHRGDRRELHG